MKNRFFKLFLATATLFFVCNCGDESPAAAPRTAYVVKEPSYLYEQGDIVILISGSGVVSDQDGNVVGTADIQNGIVYDLNGNVAFAEINFAELDVIEPTVVTAPAWILAAEQNYVIYPDGNVTDANGNPVGMIFLKENTMVGDIVNFEGVTLFSDVDLDELKTFVPAQQSPNGDSGNGSANVDPYNNQGNENNVDPYNGGNGQGEENQPVQRSSASRVKSSSSSAKSTVKSSSSSAKQVSGKCPTIKVKGSGGSGFATRYWDGCKPSCSWKENAGNAGPSKQCSANGKSPNTDYSAKSVCDGGSAATCTSQIPFTIDGCSEMGFAFAAVPASNGGQCGKCFQLTFTGTGKYETKANQKALAGKKLIIMVTNVGVDVEHGQFDIMIPGGGVGIYNGTSGYGWGNQGKQYGGLLGDCEDEIGYNANDLLTKRKECLVKKCNSVFSSDATAKQGCLFLANFMEAAGNPNHEYVEVECPQELSSKY